MVTWQEIDAFTKRIEEQHLHKHREKESCANLANSFKTLITRITNEGLTDEHDKQLILNRKHAQFIRENQPNLEEQAKTILRTWNKETLIESAIKEMTEAQLRTFVKNNED